MSTEKILIWVIKFSEIKAVFRERVEGGGVNVPSKIFPYQHNFFWEISHVNLYSIYIVSLQAPKPNRIIRQ